jgi:soluble lytic murein transglycosylase-like protein
MISFPKIFFGFLVGSLLLIITAIKLATPIEQVSASSTINSVIEENSLLIDNKKEDSTNECLISSNYPQSIQQWCSMIVNEANKFGLDPNLIAAVMLQESGGDPNAYSTSGAVGLMQIMPRDGIAEKFMCINGPCFTNRPSSEELFNPQFNIEYGSRMLSNLFSRYGDWRDALKSYGPMDVGYSYADIVLSIYHNY